MINYDKAEELMCKVLGEDTNSQISSLQQQIKNLQQQNTTLDAQKKQNNIKIASIQTQIANLGGNVVSDNTNGED